MYDRLASNIEICNKTSLREQFGQRNKKDWIGKGMTGCVDETDLHFTRKE